MTLREQLDTVRKHQQSAPVNVVPLARDLGIEVYRSDDMPKDYSGMIVRDENGGSSGYSIYVNARHPDVRRRFTIAHEIAHFLLHRALIGDGLEDDGLYRSGLSNAVEKQANRLAADILMPRHLIAEVVASGTVAHDDVDGLARLFNVSRDAMSIRVLGVSAAQPAQAGL